MPQAIHESFAQFNKRLNANILLESKDETVEQQEQKNLEAARNARFDRKRQLLYENLDLILRRKDEILATPRYANIDAHYAIKGGGAYIGYISFFRVRHLAGSTFTFNLTLKSLLKIWESDQFRATCECGKKAVISNFAGSPLSGASVATARCPHCKKELRGIRGRSFSAYLRPLRAALSEDIKAAMHELQMIWDDHKLEGDRSEHCSLETMIQELMIQEFKKSNF